METVNARPHRGTRRPPVEMLAEERQRLPRIPDVTYTAAFGETRKVSWSEPRLDTADEEPSCCLTLLYPRKGRIGHRSRRGSRGCSSRDTASCCRLSTLGPRLSSWPISPATIQQRSTGFTGIPFSRCRWWWRTASRTSSEGKAVEADLVEGAQ
jgi:hypothetical protein